MRALLQRVSYARVRVAGEVRGEIGPGLCAFVAVTHTDTGAVAERLARRVWYLRVLDDGAGSIGSSLAEKGGEVLVVSQFTLYGDTSRGRRPSWSVASPAEHAEPLLGSFVEALRSLGALVSTGVFGAHMEVELCNEGPMTVTLDA